MIKRYCVFGNPVEHSLSPQIHLLFGDLVQRRIAYEKIQVETGDFERAVREFAASGAQGCNVTAPFKGEAYDLCSKHSEAARLAEAVNTIKFMPDGSFVGHNTDGSGLVRDITGNLSTAIKDKNILIAGAGGATRGILQPLLSEQPAAITITNRSIDKAQALANSFCEFGNVDSISLEALNERPSAFDIVINATSLGFDGQRPLLSENLLNKNSLAYDLAYANEDTPFVTWAKQSSAAVSIDGLGMLVEQAADAFFIWEDVRPKTRLVLPSLR